MDAPLRETDAEELLTPPLRVAAVDEPLRTATPDDELLVTLVAPVRGATPRPEAVDTPRADDVDTVGEELRRMFGVRRDDPPILNLLIQQDYHNLNYL